eukprot:scaffold11391_cov125-Isochrysis_galbana.AAC.2
MANSTAAPHTLGHARLMRARSRSAACLARDAGPGRAAIESREYQYDVEYLQSAPRLQIVTCALLRCGDR